MQKHSSFATYIMSSANVLMGDEGVVLATTVNNAVVKTPTRTFVPSHSCRSSQ